MSFDIFFQPCRFAEVAVEKTDPTTGNTRKILPNDPLTAQELLAVQNILKKWNASAPDRFGCQILEFNAGGYAEVYGRNLETGCMVALRGMAKDVINFLFELLQAANWTMIPAMEDTRAIAASAKAFQRIPQGFPPTVVCESSDELEILLGKGFDAWKRYRDQVVGRSSAG